MKALRLTTVLAAFGGGVFVGWTSLIVASFMRGKGDLGIGQIDFDRDGVL